MTIPHSPNGSDFLPASWRGECECERYRLATEQIVHAERHGFESRGSPSITSMKRKEGCRRRLSSSPKSRRSRPIRLGTGIITLPLENPVRVAEDTAVLDLLSGGRLEVGVGTGGTPSSFKAFGQDSAKRSEIYDQHLAIVRDAWDGRPLTGGDTLYPAAPGLNDRVWQATFSVGEGFAPERPATVSCCRGLNPGRRTHRTQHLRHSASHHRCLSRGAAQRTGAADRGFTFTVRRRQPG